MMSPAQLAELLLLSTSDNLRPHTEELVEKIRVAMAFHKREETGGSGDSPLLDSEDPRLFTPRLYTTERYCATLNVEHYRNLPSYAVRKLVFSAHAHMADPAAPADDATLDWTVEVYPKGVWFQRCLTVYGPLPGLDVPGLEVPERVLRTVRASVVSATEENADCSFSSSEERRVRVALLLWGEQDGFPHVRKVVTRNYFFNGTDRVLNFDDVLDFDELSDMKIVSPFLVGQNRDAIKVSVVVAPLNKLSCLETA